MKRRILTLLALAVAACGTAFAASTADVQRLIASGQLNAAQSALDAALKSKPKDAELRFLLGVVLTDLGQTQAAVQVFTELSQEFPELPDPWNNLAVLHASRGDLDAARSALESALRKNPQHRAARENMGDVYLRMALREWERAATGSTSDPALLRKLSLARSLILQLSPPRATAAPQP